MGELIMFTKRVKQAFGEYTPAFDALLSITILSIITIGVLSVPSADSYMQDVHIDILTVQARQIAVPETLLNYPDLGVLYEIGKYDVGSTPVYRSNFRDGVISGSKSFLIDSDKLAISPEIAQQYEFYITFPQDYSPPPNLANSPGGYGLCWIMHPTTNPSKPLNYIVIKH